MARSAPGVLWVPPVLVHQRFWGGEGPCVCGVGLWVYLGGLCQAPEDIRVVLGRGEVGGVDSWGEERNGQHGFPYGLRNAPPRWLEAAVLCQPLAELVDQALEGGLCLGPLLQLRELRVGQAPPPLSLGGALALG